MLFLALFTLLISASSQAVKCPGEDVRLDHQGGSMELVKPRNQGSLQVCYAFGAAEVWDAYRFSHYDKKTLEKEKGFYTIPMQGALAVSLEKKKENKFDMNAVGTELINKGGNPTNALLYYMTHPDLAG